MIRVIGGREKKHDFLTLKSPFFQIQQNFRILENLSSIQNLPFICSRFYEEAYKKELMTKLTYGYSRFCHSPATEISLRCLDNFKIVA